MDVFPATDYGWKFQLFIPLSDFTSVCVANDSHQRNFPLQSVFLQRVVVDLALFHFSPKFCLSTVQCQPDRFVTHAQTSSSVALGGQQVPVDYIDENLAFWEILGYLPDVRQLSQSYLKFSVLCDGIFLENLDHNWVSVVNGQPEDFFHVSMLSHYLKIVKINITKKLKTHTFCSVVIILVLMNTAEIFLFFLTRCWSSSNLPVPKSAYFSKFSRGTSNWTRKET